MNTQLKDPTNQKFTEVPKVVRIRKHYYKTLGTSKTTTHGTLSECDVSIFRLSLHKNFSYTISLIIQQLR